MTASVTVGPIEKTCPYCEKRGLPILPLRYAVARADMGQAPSLAAPFGDGVTDIALPDKRAHYTLRLLRAGYLYVYDERYGKRGWSAYQVSEGGYLFPFNPLIEAPAGGWQQKHFSCSRQGDQAIARCITVDDAAHAKKIWLSFSDVLWTPALLEEHTTPAWRTTHMRCIDMATVRKGEPQPHACSLENLGQKVAEFAVTPAMLATETAPYVTKYLPTPFRSVAEVLGSSDAASTARKLWSPLFTGLAPGVAPSPRQTHGPLPAAAWAFSGRQFFADAELAKDLEQWHADHPDMPYQPAMAAMDDPTGMALDLNGLLHQLTAEFTEEPQRKWTMDTASTLGMVGRAVKEGALKESTEHAENEGALAKLAPYAGTVGLGLLADKLVWDHTLGAPMRRQAERLEHYDAKVKAIQQHNQTEWGQWKAGHDMNALCEAFITWTGCQRFIDCFVHHYDRKHIGSGLSFTEVIGAVFGDLDGFDTLAKHISGELLKDPTDIKNLVIRGLALNQESLIGPWVSAANQPPPPVSPGGIDASTTYSAVGSAYAGWQPVMGESATELTGIAKLVRRVTGSVLHAMGTQTLEQVLHSVGKRRLLVALGVLAKFDDPGLELVLVPRGHASTKPTIRSMARSLGRITGQTTVEHHLASERLVGDKQVTTDAIALVHADELRAAARKNGGASVGEIKNAVSVVTVDEAIEYTAAKATSRFGTMGLGVAGFVLTAINMKFTVQAFQAAAPAELLRQEFNVVGQSIGLVGAAADATDGIMKAFTARSMSAGFVLRAEAQTLSGGFLTTTGRLMGGFGGIIAGVVEVFQGYADYQDGHTTIGRVEVGEGILMIAAGVCVLAGWTGAGLVIGAVVALIALTVAYFKPTPLEDWVTRTKLGDGDLPKFKGLVPQVQALTAVGG